MLTAPVISFIFINMKSALYIILLISLLAASVKSADIPALEQWRAFSRSDDSRQLISWLQSNAASILRGEVLSEKPPVELPEIAGRCGLFITIIRNGKVRGCYGAFHHEQDISQEIFIRYLKGALFLDPRYRPMEPSELDGAEIVVTITSWPEPVDNLNNVDIAAFGLFIECEGNAGTVIVPAEFRTTSRIASLAGKRDCRYSRFRAVTIR